MSRVQDFRRRAAAAFLVRDLALKAAAFALAWLLLPIWASSAVALYFYFFPFFHSRRLFFPFILMLVFAAGLPANIWFAVLLGAILFLILGIKNLIFVNRFGNHQFLAFVLLFLAEFSFFFSLEHWNDWYIPFWSLGIGLLFFLLTRALFDYVRHEPSPAGNAGLGGPRRADVIPIGLGSLIVWQVALGTLFLPLNPLSQTALLFLVTVIVEDLLLEHARGRIDRRKLLTDFSIFFLLASFILVSAEWGL